MLIFLSNYFKLKDEYAVSNVLAAIKINIVIPKTMKIKFLTIATLFATHQLFSQTTNCDNVKSENLQLKNYVQQLKSDSIQLQKEDDYLKQTLKIFKPIKTANKLKIDFNLIACEGDIQEQKVTVTFNLINTDVNKSIQFNIDNFNRGQTAVDVQGNVYNTDKITVGAEKYASKIFTDVPVKATITFVSVPSSALIFKMIGIKGFTSDSQAHLTNFEVQYKDISITWK